MKTLNIFLALSFLFHVGCAQDSKNNSKTLKMKKLTTEEAQVILYKGTERPFTGKYNTVFDKGTYICKQCGAALYQSDDKFKSECGWPSFDDEIKDAVKHVPDTDGQRTEIQCSACGAHLGHIFIGEGFSPKNTRHCVNSISLEFIPAQNNPAVSDTAIFAGGCFWGVEYYMHEISGVISTEVGYIGGKTNDPTYKDVCSHSSGHAEAVRVIFDPSKTNFETIAKTFFEIHDPTQVNRQGPDIGDQYRSEVFYLDEKQKAVTLQLIEKLQKSGLKVATKVEPASHFWTAEEYHQQYYSKKNGTPYCHARVKRF